MMQLEEPEPDVFLARGPQYPWGGLYGGQIVAQGLRAGAATVEDRFHVHSLHAYFIRPGNADEAIRFDVTRSRDGRSFCTRHVVASQEVGVILTMSLSFQVDEAGHDVQTARLPDVPRPRTSSTPRGAPSSSAASRCPRRGGGSRRGVAPDAERGRRRSGAAGLRAGLPVRRHPHRRRRRRPPRPPVARGRRARPRLDVSQPRPRHLVPPPVRGPTSGTCTTSPPTATCRAVASASATS